MRGEGVLLTPVERGKLARNTYNRVEFGMAKPLHRPKKNTQKSVCTQDPPPVTLPGGGDQSASSHLQHRDGCGRSASRSTSSWKTTPRGREQPARSSTSDKRRDHVRRADDPRRGTRRAIGCTRAEEPRDRRPARNQRSDRRRPSRTHLQEASPSLAHGACIAPRAVASRKEEKMSHKWLLLLLLGVVGTAIYGGIALATPPSGLTQVPLARGTDLSDGTLPLQAGTDVAMAQITVVPGGSSGWHSHPGGAIIVVKQGTLTVYRSLGSQCQTSTYSAGQAYVESGRKPRGDVGMTDSPGLEVRNGAKGQELKEEQREEVGSENAEREAPGEASQEVTALRVGSP